MSNPQEGCVRVCTIKGLSDDALKALIIYRITIDGGDLFDFKLAAVDFLPVMRRCQFDYVPGGNEYPLGWLLGMIENIQILQPQDLGELNGFSVNLGRTLRDQVARLIHEWMDTRNYSKDCTEEDKHFAEIRPMQTLVATYSTAYIKIEPILQNGSMAVSALYNTKAETLPDTVQSLWDSSLGEEHFVTNMTARNGVSDDFGYNGVYLPKFEVED